MSLQAEGVTVGYMEYAPILNEVSITAPAGCTTAVIGPNGAGKSTLLKTLCGLLKPLYGRIIFDGRDITHMSLKDILKLGISYIPQDNLVFPKLSVEHNLMIAAKTHGMKNELIEKRLSEVLQYFPTLRDKLRYQAGDLSGGLQKMIAIGRSMILDSRLLLLDEPTASLSPIVAHELYENLKKLKRQGKTMILVEQDVQAALALADYVYVLDAGRVTHYGRSDKILDSIESIVQGWLKI